MGELVVVLGIVVLQENSGRGGYKVGGKWVTGTVMVRDMALPPRDQRHQYLRVQVFNFGGLPDLMAEGLSARMLMEHMDAQEFGEAVLDLDMLGALQFQLGGARRRLSWRQFISALGLHTTEEMETVRFGAYWAKSVRQIPDKGDLRDYWIGISLLEISLAQPRLTLRLGIRFLGWMDVGSVNIPYLLARYLRLFVAGRKSEALISGGQFVARLAKHFGLLMEERLRGSIVIAPELPIINMTELVRVAQDAPAVNEGDQAVSVPVQAPPPLAAAAARTMLQRMV
ncbi:hypothetical protein Tco_0799496 [Tanacetum coccineum]|uniref:Uncharacterized protein n=1 Tax=Tanacetum coccineum TaxID=301880 RepID=A0ABQ4ZUW2_9ASTR